MNIEMTDIDLKRMFFRVLVCLKIQLLSIALMLNFNHAIDWSQVVTIGWQRGCHGVVNAKWVANYAGSIIRRSIQNASHSILLTPPQTKILQFQTVFFPLNGA